MVVDPWPIVLTLYSMYETIYSYYTSQGIINYYFLEINNGLLVKYEN